MSRKLPASYFKKVEWKAEQKMMLVAVKHIAWNSIPHERIIA